MKPRKLNEYIKKDDYYEIILYKPKTYDQIASVYISEEDFDKCSKIYWTLSKYGYCRGYDKINKREILLHKYILNSDKNELYDHINKNKLDCRRNNLRIANKQINSINREAPSNSLTSITGVSFDKKRNKYRAYVKINQKQIFLGYYINIEDAIIARKNGELKYFKPIIDNY